MQEPRPLLLVEDNSSDIELTLAALDAHGLAGRVQVVRDAAEALEHLRRCAPRAGHPSRLPAAVLLDIKLPRVGGLDLLRALRADAAFRQLPVIMLSSSREEADLRRSYELGANGYVVKPVDFARFAEALRHLMLFWGDINEPPPPPIPTAPPS